MLALEAPRGYLAGMRSVGLKVLKNKLSEYIRIAASGETILVLDRDRVVAELAPPREGRSPVLEDARLADLVRSGKFRPASITGEIPPRKPVRSDKDLLDELARDREDR